MAAKEKDRTSVEFHDKTTNSPNFMTKQPCQNHVTLLAS